MNPFVADDPEQRRTLEEIFARHGRSVDDLPPALIRELVSTLGAPTRDEAAAQSIAMNNAPQGMAILQNDRVVYANATAAKMALASSRDDLLGRHFMDFVPDNMTDQVEGVLRMLDHAREVPGARIRLLDTTGTPRSLELTVRAIQYRNASAVLVVLQDLSEYRRVPYLLRRILAGISTRTGSDFFHDFVASLARTLELPAAFVARLEPDSDSLDMIAVHVDGRSIPGFRFERHQIPSLEVDSANVVVREADLQQAFPDFVLARDYGFTSYVGVPLLNQRRDELGLLVALDRKPFENLPVLITALRIFAERAATELERARVTAQLFESEYRFRTLMKEAADPIIVVDSRGKISYANRMMHEMVETEDLVNRPLARFMDEESARTLDKDYNRLRERQQVQLLRTIKRASGSALRVEISAIILEDGSVQAILRDVTARERLEEERQSYLRTIALLDEVVLELDADFRMERLSDSWERMFKGFDSSPVGVSLAEIVHSDYRDYLTEHLARLHHTDGPVIVRFPLPRGETANAWIEGKFIPVRNRDRELTGFRGVLRDVTVEHLTDRQVNFYAYYDNLTGLPNRIRMEENLQRSLARAESTNARLAIGIIDLDNFDEINNYMGHRVGDRILLNAAERLSDVLEPGQSLYRWGGDQFVLIATDCDRDGVARLGERMLTACHRPFEIDQKSFQVSYSIGFAVHPEDGINMEILLGAASRALAHAKTSGKYAYRLPRDLPEEAFFREQAMARSDLVTAIRSGEIVAYFHPRIDASRNRIVGMEALARWVTPGGGFRMSPAMFIPLAENMGLIAELGQKILEDALKTVSRVKAEIGAELRVSVNVSRRQLLDRGFPQKFADIVAQHGLSTSEVILEITESVAMMEAEIALETLSALHDAAFPLSIDDFGTGYSTLAQLHEMPVSELKVDMSFVRRIDTYEGFQVVQAIANMGRALDLDVVAEGVDTVDRRDRLISLGIDLLQGDLFSAPLSADEFLELVRKDSETAAH